MPLLVTDADNTLWNTNAVFAKCQLSLLSKIEQTLGTHLVALDRLTFVRTIDQELATLHGGSLRYDARLLVRGIANALTGISPKDAAKKVLCNDIEQDQIPIDELASGFILDLRSTEPDLREGVPQTLKALFQRNIIIVVATEGNQQRCKELLVHYNLDSYIKRIFEGNKTAAFFEHISNECGFPKKKVAVGDQLDRDIEPSKKAGYLTVYFPGDFLPVWNVSKSTKDINKQINNFKELLDMF